MENAVETIAENYVQEIGGKEALKIFRALKSLGEATDEKIAEVTGIHLNTVRRILYELYERRILFYRRERDEETGWLTYYWRIDLSEFESHLKDELRRFLRNLKEKLRYEEENTFYICPNLCERVKFEEASENEFRCRVCGEMLIYEDNSRRLEGLRRCIEDLEAILNTE
ncbi:MAG: transcription initiation factor subunit alpha [Archaeoglobi archaeon]|nr:transcription initiation factor subunit alpha [Archaeoglobi archaeon]MDK2781374.1 transcription initiation factor subunit alpha [Archaeoglobi archaeon]